MAVGLVIILATAGIVACWTDGRQGSDFTRSATPAEQELIQQVKSGGVTNEALNRAAAEGIAKLKRHEEQQEEVATSSLAATEVGDKEWPIKDTWEVQFPNGVITVVYLEADSAKDVISFKVDKKARTTVVDNLLTGQSVRLVSYAQTTAQGGKTTSSSRDWGTISPGETLVYPLTLNTDGNWQLALRLEVQTIP